MKNGTLIKRPEFSSKRRIWNDREKISGLIIKFVKTIISAYDSEKKVFICANGGGVSAVENFVVDKETVFVIYTRETIRGKAYNNFLLIESGFLFLGNLLVREALKGYPYHGNLCAAVINHANSVGRKLQDDIKQLIQKV